MSLWYEWIFTTGYLRMDVKLYFMEDWWIINYGQHIRIFANSGMHDLSQLTQDQKSIFFNFCLHACFLQLQTHKNWTECISDIVKTTSGLIQNKKIMSFSNSGLHDLAELTWDKKLIFSDFLVSCMFFATLNTQRLDRMCFCHHPNPLLIRFELKKDFFQISDFMTQSAHPEHLIRFFRFLCLCMSLQLQTHQNCAKCVPVNSQTIFRVISVKKIIDFLNSRLHVLSQPTPNIEPNFADFCSHACFCNCKHMKTVQNAFLTSHAHNFWCDFDEKNMKF